MRQELWCDPASTRADIPRDDLLADPRWREGYRTLGDPGLSFARRHLRDRPSERRGLLVLDGAAAAAKMAEGWTFVTSTRVTDVAPAKWLSRRAFR